MTLLLPANVDYMKLNTEEHIDLTDIVELVRSHTSGQVCLGLNLTVTLFTSNIGLIILLLSPSFSSSVKWGENRTSPQDVKDKANSCEFWLALGQSLTFSESISYYCGRHLWW